MVLVGDTNNNPASGAVVTTSAPVVYADASGLPIQSAAQTTSSGIAYLFNARPDLGSISAAIGQTRPLELDQLDDDRVRVQP